ncbi:hypothetical protein ES702_05207 [subsurface metagenome]
MDKTEELLGKILKQLCDQAQLDSPYNVLRYRHLNRNETVEITNRACYLDRVVVNKGGDQCELTIYDGEKIIHEGILSEEFLRKGCNRKPYSFVIGTEINNKLKVKLHIPAAKSHFKLNAITGATATDSGSNKTDGILTNMANEDWVAGMLHNALDFDGENDYVDCGNVNAFENDDAFSISFWAYQHDHAATEYFFAKRQVTSEKGYGFWTDTSGKAYFHIIGTPNTNSIIIKTVTNFTLNDWEHYVLTYDGSGSAAGMKIYRNRTLLQTEITNDNIAGTVVSTTDFNIGCMRGGGNPFNGLIDDFRIYDEELSSEQVSLIYNQGIGTEEDFNVADITIVYKESVL